MVELRMTRTLTLTLLGLLFAGCVSIGNQALLDEATIAQIKPGQTTMEQVTALLGEPNERRTIQLSGYTYEWWAYRHAASVINPLEYLLLVGFFFNGIGLPDTERDLGVFFNPDGIVRSLAQQTTSYDMGTPVDRMNVTSMTATTVSFAGPPGEPIRYEDKMETSY